jgi:hypothetical protein
MIYLRMFLSSLAECYQREGWLEVPEAIRPVFFLFAGDDYRNKPQAGSEGGKSMIETSRRKIKSVRKNECEETFCG